MFDIIYQRQTREKNPIQASWHRSLEIYLSASITLISALCVNNSPTILLGYPLLLSSLIAIETIHILVDDVLRTIPFG